ncbi:GAF domain-containing protein [Phormidium tenue FACHB-886]|nr:GAF domain-containing protein [Phormidium tenue FACHB-886]
MTQWSSEQAPSNSKASSTSEFENTQVVEQAAAFVPFPEPQAQPTSSSILLEQQMDAESSSTFFQKHFMRWWGERGLRFKVMTLAVTLATIPVMAIGGAAYLFASQTFTQRVTAESEEYSLSVQNKINLFLRQRLGDIRVMSQLSIFTDPRQRAESNSRQNQEALDRFVEAYEVYDSIAVTDLKGNVLAQSIGEQLPNLSNRRYFQEALKADKPIISQPEAGTLTQVLSIYVVAPIRESGTGKTIGLIHARIPGDYFRMAVLNEAVQQTNAKIYLIDGNGKLFVTPEGIGAASVDDQGRPIVNAEGEVQAIDAQSLFPNYEQFQSEDGPVVNLSAQELLTLTPITDLRDLPPLAWKLLVTENRSTAFAAQDQLLLTLQLGTSIAILLAGAIAALIANRTIMPILAATHAVTKIGQGNLDTRLNVQGKDEIAVLGVNINHMAAYLQESLEARAFEAAQERILTAAKGSGALRATDLQAIFDQAVESIHDLLKLDRVVIYRLDNDAGVVSEAVSAGWASALTQEVKDFCFPEQLRKTYRKGQITTIYDVSETTLHPEHSQLLERLNVRSSLIVPIVGGDRLFGLLIAHSCFVTRQWQELEIDFFKRLSTELGLSIYRVTLLEETEKLAEEQRQLKEKLQSRALELLKEVEPIGNGDLTIRAQVTGDEIGTIADSYNATVDNLRKLVLQVKDAVHQVVDTTRINQASVQTLSVGATEQVEEIKTALERVEEVVAAVRNVATNAKKAEMVTKQAVQTVEAGDAAIDRIVESNQMIRTTVTETAKKVENLTEASQRISSVVDLIRGFAAQTRMLAFNVSIEASRTAGEGQVIDAIAREVHALVEQSEGATKEIRELVASIQAETEEVATAMKSSTKQVALGTALVDETRQSLNEVTDASFQVNRLVQSITEATMVQQHASETIARTMTDVAAIAQKTLTETNQVSSSFEQLRTTAQLLQEGVDQFKVN